MEHTREPGYNIDPEDDEKATPLWHAVSINNEPFIELLLKVGANIKTMNKKGVSILHLAAKNGNSQLIAKAIGGGADVNALDETEKSPLSYAVSSGNTESVTLLLSAHANIDYEYRACVTVLHEAVKSGNIEIVKLMLHKFKEMLPDTEYKAVIDSKADEDDGTPLLSAVMDSNRDLVDLLLGEGAKLQAFDSYGDSELSCAISFGREDIVSLLLNHNPEIESKSNQGMTPFLWAAHGGHVAIGQLLLDKNADISAIDNDGQSALYWATYDNHVPFMELLFQASTKFGASQLQTRAPSDAIDEKKNSSKPHTILSLESASQGTEWRTPLVMAAANGSREAVALLLKNGADYEAIDDNGWTSLHHAVVASQFKPTPTTPADALATVNTLLSTNSSVIVNVKNKDGNTALHLAVESNDDEIVKMLLEKCPPFIGNYTTEQERAISLTQQNVNGHSPLSLAVKQSAASIVQLLVAAAADIEYVEELRENGKQRWVPLMVESDFDSSTVETLLLGRRSYWEDDPQTILYW
jgi:ankyrin repeat protein